MIKPRRHCVLQHAETGENMQRDVATSSSDHATPPRSPFLGRLNNDLDCQENVAVSDRESQLSDLRTLATGLSELHPGSLAVSGWIEILGPALVLLPALASLRAFLSRAWGVDTVYPESSTRSSWIPGTPHGQCGVSSAWLAEILHHQFLMSSTFCEGSLIFSNNQAENVLDHCWLELNGLAGEELVLDLTCDQAQGFDRAIVLDAKTHLDRQGVRYIRRDWLSTSDLPNSPVWPRYQTLRRKLGSPSP
jgi:hypothetical protein